MRSTITSPWTEVETWSEQASEVDPYEGIRHAMAPEHAELPANEITVNLGSMPARLVLHQLLRSPETEKATLAALLGRRARQSVRFHGSDVPVHAYLRMIGHLCREVAEQSESEGAGEYSPSGETEYQVSPADLRMLQGELNGAVTVSESESESETPKCINSTHEINGFPEYAVNPDKLSIQQQATLLRIASEIAASLSTDHPIVALLAVGHADTAMRKPPAERPAFEHTISQQRAENAASLIMNEVRRLAGTGSQTVKTRAIGVGSTQRVVQNPRTEPERRANRRVVILLAQCDVPNPIPPPADDLKDRIERVIRLLSHRRVDPDTTGTRTIRALCLMQKMLKPGVIDVFVDGGVANETINGKTPRFDECIIPGRNVGWLGNYDSKAHPMVWPEFAKFLGLVKPILRGSGLALSQSDDQVLKVLGDVVLRIDLGVEMTDQYIARMGIMSDPLVTLLFKKDGFAGDPARKKLQSIYRANLDDENNIYSCWK